MLETNSGWRRFWERGDWWRALILAAVYYALYELFVWAVAAFVGTTVPADGGAGDLLLRTGVPILLGVCALIAFAASLGWLPELFTRQAVSARRWMWIAVVVVLAVNVSSVLSIDYNKAGAALTGAWLLTGLCIGAAEEILTRGFVVNMMRKAGRRETSVALTSAGIFAALHIGNVFTSDQSIATTASQVVYTFAFGICMYLALRVTRTIWGPILLHASTDPTLSLHGAYPESNLFGVLSASSTILIVISGATLAAVLFVSERRAARALAST
ncbi:MULTISPECIES: CPBP family intramembrane glutamic endopeptidase [unclassified Microbacterium]|uniref:CPBP family intramembrane glutamic endopeptidase n=1 Tax=unclassified Microbacterium TaxID=2609290 RepID=UPI0021A8E282|nr:MULTISPECIES: CPBP family intramembrane glutamic endopeptidase [unclassified Microbacterium]MCT1364089.1 CPBP family intramembrane metalloprotease [Microbacterium sp. p3-SID131]MCT1375269.1 CPBP family intramembrane metalloprotease [Microbacterium sp. p3-SID337]